MKDNEFNQVCQNITNSYYYRDKVSVKNFEKLINRFIKLLFMQVFNLEKPIKVIIIDSQRGDGMLKNNDVLFIDRRLVQEFKNGKPLRLFETIFHEFNHYKQMRDYNYISIKNLLIEKDNYLTNIYKDNYYRVNYGNLMSEVDSFINQGNDAIFTLKALNISPSEDEIIRSNETKKHYENNLFSTKRTVDNEVCNVHAIFDRIITANSLLNDNNELNEFLKLNPTIALEYKLEDGLIVRKNSKELKKLYNEWNLGFLNLNGNNKDIHDYFKYVIKYANEYENIIKKER